MIVADANIIAYLLIQGERTAQARQLYADDPDWIVPALWQHEFLNVLSTWVKHGGGDITDALGLWHTAQTLLLHRERPVALLDALKLAVTSEISAYDAQYLALANMLDCTLVTEDKRLLQKFPDRAMTMHVFLQHKNGAN